MRRILNRVQGRCKCVSTFVWLTPDNRSQFTPIGPSPNPKYRLKIRLIAHFSLNPAHDSLQLVDEASAPRLAIGTHEPSVIRDHIVRARVEARPHGLADIAEVAQRRVGVVHLVGGRYPEARRGERTRLLRVGELPLRPGLLGRLPRIGTL